jgi:pyruvate, orthophosphate dikinase
MIAHRSSSLAERERIPMPDLSPARSSAARAVRARTSRAPRLEVMIPRVAYASDLARDLVLRVAADEETTDVLVGTMIELPRACLAAGTIARHAAFFLLRHERPDTDRAGVLARRHRGADRARLRRPRDPSTARRSRRSTARAWASCWRSPSHARARRGRGSRPACAASTGGDPASIGFFHAAGLDHVSCSPFRVPVARVTAAQAAIAG